MDIKQDPEIETPEETPEIETLENDTKHVIINYWRSDDEGKSFDPIPLSDVPVELKTDLAMQKMLDGLGAHLNGSVYLITRSELH